ncbi:MAG: hypothetical protein WAK67_15995, partial [Xanthobacteraceae bacterium]
DDDEFRTLKKDAGLNAAVSLLAVLIILWLALRSARIIFAVAVNSRHSAPQRTMPYSITWSVRASGKGGRLNPIDLAVLRLTVSQNRVGSSAGRSDGFLL